MEAGNLVKLIGRRWDILAKLSEKKCNLSQLSYELKKSLPQVYKELKELEENDLVRFEKEGRHKYYYVSQYADMICKAIKQVIEFKPKGKLEEWQVEEFLNILEDQSLSGTLRKSFTESFVGVCREHPLDVVGYSRVRELFEKVVQDKVNEDLVQKLRVGVWDVLRHVSRYEDQTKWVGKEIYPLLERNVEVGDEQTRLFAIKLIGEIAVNSVDPFLKSKAEKKLVEIWYSPDTDPNSKFGQDVLKWLVLLSSRWLFDDAKAKAKDDKYRVKAELLLEKLKEVLLPK